MTDSPTNDPNTPPASPVPPLAEGPIKLPPVKLPPKPIVAGMPPMPSIPTSVPTNPGVLRPPGIATPPEVVSPSSVTPPAPRIVKPVSASEPASVKPVPQATVNLQQVPLPAPASSVARPLPQLTTQLKNTPPAPATVPLAKQPSISELNLRGTHEEDDSEVSHVSSDIPLPFAMAAAALAFLAVLIQLWMLIS